MTFNPLRRLIASSGLVILAVVVALALLGGGQRLHAPAPAGVAGAR